jgi:hypothetical protein
MMAIIRNLLVRIERDGSRYGRSGNDTAINRALNGIYDATNREGREGIVQIQYAMRRDNQILFEKSFLSPRTGEGKMRDTPGGKQPTGFLALATTTNQRV